MQKLYEIVDEEIELDVYLSKVLNKVLAKKGFNLEVVNQDKNDLISEMDLLIEDVFPPKEVDDHKPSQLLYLENNPLCIACVKKGVVIGGMTVNFDFENNSVSLISIAVDAEYRDKKVGSLLMLALHDICQKLEITSISLISSSAGKGFYKSFGFKEMGHNSFERTIPFEENIINNKLTSKDPIQQQELAKVLDKKRSHEALTGGSIFKTKNYKDLSKAPQNYKRIKTEDTGLNSSNGSSGFW